MAKFPTKPQRGDKALQSIYNTVCDIVDYLPSLNVVGDNKTTYVNHSAGGTTIHAVQPHNTIQNKSNEYFAGSGIAITSGNTINAMISGGDNINVWEQSGYIVISGTPEGSGGPGTDTTYIGDKNTTPSCHIYVSQTGDSPRLISSDLVYIDNLLNYPISGDNIGSQKHFTQIMNFQDGAGTKFDYHWNSIGNHEEDDPSKPLIKWIDGVTYNMNVSGGQYVRGTFHQGVGYGDYSQASIDCLLSGDRDVYSPVGFITIVPSVQDDGLTGGIISTILHGDNSTISIANDGTISCILDPGGTTIIASGVQYPDYASLYNDDNGTVSGIGISWLLPVKKDEVVKFYTDAIDEIQPEQEGGETTYKNFAFGTFAPAVGESGSRVAMSNGVPITAECDGWVRVSVFDDGLHEGRCLRFYTGDSTFQTATPLYRFHGFTNYQAGAGIAIKSGIISAMAQPGQGLTSSALYDGNSNPYDPNRPITGIAFDLSTQFYNDLTTISGRTINKVLSSSSNGTLTWATNVEPGGDVFDSPDYAKLGVSPDAGEEALGLGTTFLVPVSKNSNVKYEADGGTIVARWAPIKGSSQTAFNLTTTNQSTPDDGYVRISVIDPGTLDYGCVRLYVDNKALPLHKFAKFNYSSGAIYEGGRYTTIQTTSTRVNPQTEQEEEYQLENPIINNMLTGGRFITIQEEENNVELEYPRINCDLSEGTNIEITTGGVINCTLTGTSQLTNDAGYITTVDIPPSTTYIGESGIVIEPILDEDENPTTSSTIGLSSQFYNDLTAISTRPATGDKILSSHNGTLSWETNNASSPTWSSLTPDLLAIDNNNHTLSAATQSGGSGGGTTLLSTSFMYTTGIVALEPNAELMVMCNTPMKNGQEYFQYYFYIDDPPTRHNQTMAALEDAIGHAPVLLSSLIGGEETGFDDDEGNILVVLPEVTEPCFVKINIFEYSTAVLAVSVNGKTIIDWDGANGWQRSGSFVMPLNDDGSGDTKEWRFFYIPSTSGWPSPNNGNYATAYEPINRTSGAWICYKQQI